MAFHQVAVCSVTLTLCGRGEGILRGCAALGVMVWDYMRSGIVCMWLVGCGSSLCIGGKVMCGRVSV